MKKLLCIIILMLQCLGLCAAWCENCADTCCQFFVEFRPGVWVFQDKVLRASIDSGIFTFQTDVGWSFRNKYDIGISGQYLSHEGRLPLCPLRQVGACPSLPWNCYFSEQETKTRLKLGLLSAFFRYHFNFCHDFLNFYVGAGPRIFFFRNENKSPFVANLCKTTAGGFVSLGTDIYLCDNVYFDVAVDYSLGYLSCKKCDRSTCCKTCLNGATVSCGLGINF